MKACVLLSFPFFERNFFLSCLADVTITKFNKTRIAFKVKLEVCNNQI